MIYHIIIGTRRIAPRGRVRCTKDVSNLEIHEVFRNYLTLAIPR